MNSMTGYGRAEENGVTVEIKSVNSRYLETNIRTGSLYIFLEEPIKQHITKQLARGKVSCFVSIDVSDDVEITLNEPIAAAYLQAAETLSARFRMKNDISLTKLLTMRDVLTSESPEIDNEALQTHVLSVVDAALAQLCMMREREGAALKADLLARSKTVAALAEKLLELSPRAVEAYRAKIDERMRELLEENFDEQRVLGEAAIFADKVAIDEEVVRLRSHLAQLHAMLDTPGETGRKLDFLLQECNREVNTVGSKCNDLDMSQLVIELKAELEKIREQIQNIE